MIAAVLFDLDDTLFPQEVWLDGAWHAVAERATAFGASRDELYDALVAVGRGGSDQSRIIKSALARCGRTDIPVTPLVNAFREYAPESLDAYPGVVAGLSELRDEMPVAVVTDGDPHIQLAKLRALRLGIDTVICSDDLGREHRKPDPLPFQTALETLGVAACQAVYVGDRPDTDVAGAHGVGMRAIRVRTGAYAAMLNEIEPWCIVATAAEAIAIVRRERRTQ